MSGGLNLPNWVLICTFSRRLAEVASNVWGGSYYCLHVRFWSNGRNERRDDHAEQTPKSVFYAASRQGNRVKKSCGDETCEKFVVPCGNFSFKAQAVFAGGLSDQVEGHVFYGGEVGRGVIGSDAAFVIAKDHVHYPM